MNAMLKKCNIGFAALAVVPVCVFGDIIEVVPIKQFNAERPQTGTIVVTYNTDSEQVQIEGSCKVYRGTFCDHNGKQKQVAVKIYNDISSGGQQSGPGKRRLGRSLDTRKIQLFTHAFLRECAVGKQLAENPHKAMLETIGAFYDASKTSGWAVIVTEYFDGEPLKNILDTDGEHPMLSPEVASRITRQIEAGVQHIHELKIFHGDLITRVLDDEDGEVNNILFNRATKDIKIIDFGGTRYQESSYSAKDDADVHRLVSQILPTAESRPAPPLRRVAGLASKMFKLVSKMFNFSSNFRVQKRQPKRQPARSNQSANVLRNPQC